MSEGIEIVIAYAIEFGLATKEEIEAIADHRDEEALQKLLDEVEELIAEVKEAVNVSIQALGEDEAEKMIDAIGFLEFQKIALEAKQATDRMMRM